MSGATWFILNGPDAGEQHIPFDNRPFIVERASDGSTRSYVPAPADLWQALGPCLVLSGSFLEYRPEGIVVICHPRWVRTVFKPRTGYIREIEGDVKGAGMPITDRPIPELGKSA